MTAGYLATPEKALRVLVVDPSLFTLPYDRAFCRALAEIQGPPDRRVKVTLIGRPLRTYEVLKDEPFAFEALFYKGTGARETGWRTSRLGRIRKGLEHVAGLRALTRRATSTPASIIHLQWLMLPFLDRFALARLRRRAGLVLTVHNAEIATHSSSAIVGRLGAMLQAMGQTEAVSIFDRYVAHTIKTVKQLERLGIAPERILLMPHPPLDLDTAAPSTVPAPGKASWNFLFFGSIKPYKGVDILIEAGLRVASMRRDFRIIIAGRPFQALDGLRSRIDAAGANDLFHFDLDYLPSERLANYLTQASAVVFPYREIDGSGALALAARFHKPIIASRVGVFAEAPAKDLIRLVPAEDPKALAAALTALLNNPADLETLTDGSRRLESLLPSWPDFARACHAAYREILEERRIG